MADSELRMQLEIRNYGVVLRLGSLEKIRAWLLGTMLHSCHELFEAAAKERVDHWLASIYSIGDGVDRALDEAIATQAGDSREKVYAAAREMLIRALFEVLVWKEPLQRELQRDLKRVKRFSLEAQFGVELKRDLNLIEATLEVKGELKLVLPGGGETTLEPSGMRIPLQAVIPSPQVMRLEPRIDAEMRAAHAREKASSGTRANQRSQKKRRKKRKKGR